MGEISESEWILIKRVAAQFERALKAHAGTRIEEFLARHEESLRGLLLNKLLRIENDIRQSRGEKPTAQDYHHRFPEFLAVVNSVFPPNSEPPIRRSENATEPFDNVDLPSAREAAATIPAELANHPDYQIIREVGRGGMGVVFLAHNQIMGRDEVLKVIGSEVIERPGMLDRFRREMRAVAGLQHPNIVTAYSAFRAGGNFVFAMEYVEGFDLARRVKAKGPLPVGHACYFVYQAALGLQHAHQAGLVHRDIKPGNLMLTNVGGKAVIKILDFGLAKAGLEEQVTGLSPSGTVFDETHPGVLTQTGQLLGTPDFVAPEQITDAQSADIRADIYSLGCTLYYLLSGRAPFHARTLREVLESHHSREARLLNLVRPEVPAELAALVGRMMAKDVHSRFQTPSEVAESLVPFFTKRTAATVSSNVELKSAETPSTGLASALPTDAKTNVVAVVATASKSDVEPGAFPIPDGLKTGGERLTAVPPSAERTASRATWRRPALKGAIGISAILLVGIMFLIQSIRPKTVDRDLTVVANGTSAEPEKAKEPSTATKPGTPVAPVAPAPTPRDVVKATKADPPVPEPAPKPPELPVAKTEPPKSTPATATPPATPKANPAIAAEVPRQRHLSKFGEEVQRAIREGVRYLKSQQSADGSWSDVENEAKTGTTSLVTLALLTTGEKPESPAVRKALEYLRGYYPNDLKSTYGISLQTMVYATADPEQDKVRLAGNVAWLERAQIKPGEPVNWPGSWTYSDSKRMRAGDNSNTQFALLALFAASEVGIPVRPEVWELARNYWEQGQQASGGWAYTPASTTATASMTCAGVASLIMSSQGRLRAPDQEPANKQSRAKLPKYKQRIRNPVGSEFLDHDTIRNCGMGGSNRNLQFGINWLASRFHVSQNFGNAQQWKFYYLYGLERVGRLAGLRFIGRNDWYRLGAQELVHDQDRLGGYWQGALAESDKVLATSFALLFLAKGRATVLINKLRHRTDTDWNNDPDDVRNIVGVVSRDWKTLLTWQVADPEEDKVSELLQAPIVFFNGHHSPDFSPSACERLRKYVEKGGFIFADACCGSKEFDQGFRKLIKKIFPEQEYELRPLLNDHSVWRSKHQLAPDLHPLWGIDNGRRTVVIYSPTDLSCYWNQAARSPENPAVTASIKVGQNVIDLVTSGMPPPDKLFEE